MREGLEWLEDSTFDVGYCVTFRAGAVRRRDPAAARVRVSRTDRKSRIDANHWIEDLADEVGHQSVVGKDQVIRAGESGGWAFAVEDGGIRGMDNEALATVSVDTVAVSTTVGANAVTVFGYAEAGLLVCQYEAPDNRWGATPTAWCRNSPAPASSCPTENQPSWESARNSGRTLRMMHAEFGLALPRDAVEHGELLAAMY
ncbi:DUF6461 domain-containing protein [Yinghuangia aomiensis]